MDILLDFLLLGAVAAALLLAFMLFRARKPDNSAYQYAVSLALAAALLLFWVIAGMGLPASPPLELVFLNGFFAALWVGSALLFRKAAAQKQPPTGAGPASEPTVSFRP